MPQLKFNMNVERDEIFEKEVTVLINAEVKRQVRTSFDEVIEKQCEAEIDRISKEAMRNHYSEMITMVRHAVRKEVQDTIKTMDIKGITQEIVKEELDKQTILIRNEAMKAADETFNYTLKQKILTKMSAVIRELEAPTENSETLTEE